MTKRIVACALLLLTVTAVSIPPSFCQETPYKTLFEWKRALEEGDLETYDSLHPYTTRFTDPERGIPTRWFRVDRLIVQRKLAYRVDINNIIPDFPKEKKDEMSFSGIRLLLGKPGSNWYLDLKLELRRIENKWQIVSEAAEPHPFTKDDTQFKAYYSQSPQYQELQNHPAGKDVFLFLCNFLEEWRAEQINGEWKPLLTWYHEMSRILLKKVRFGDQKYLQFIDKSRFAEGLSRPRSGGSTVLLGIDFPSLRVQIVGEGKVKVQIMLISFDVAELRFSEDPTVLGGDVEINRVSELAMVRGESHLFVVIREIRDRGLEWSEFEPRRKSVPVRFSSSGP